MWWFILGWLCLAVILTAGFCLMFKGAGNDSVK
jgi:hypothetical protein